MPVFSQSILNVVRLRNPNARAHKMRIRQAGFSIFGYYKYIQAKSRRRCNWILRSWWLPVRSYFHLVGIDCPAAHGAGLEQLKGEAGADTVPAGRRMLAPSVR